MPSRSAPDSAGKRTPRRLLGEAWKDWDEGATERDSSAGPGLFLAFQFLLSGGLTMGWALLLWIAAPRLHSIGLGPGAVALCLGVGALLFVQIPVCLSLHLSALRLPRNLTRGLEWWVVATWPLCELMARPTRASRDRLGHSFVQMANRLSLRARRTSGRDGLLLLAPRCLRPEIMRELKQMASASGAEFVVATGGEEARAAVQNAQPGAVLAVACERDLVEGVRDVLPRATVQALANRRPEGPCRNSEIDLEKAREMIELLTQA